MSPLRVRMIQDMMLAGLATTTQTVYVEAVRRLAAHYRRSPDELTEEEVRAYLVALREREVARGTFKANHYGIQFLYRQTLDRDWALFSKKDSSPATEALAHGAVGCPGPQPALPGEEPDPQMLFDGDVCLRLTHRRGGNARSQFG